LKVKQREIILINFPFSDLTGAKVRPALVISNNPYNRTNLDTVVLAITSNLSPHPYRIHFASFSIIEKIKQRENGNVLK
jgi:mRNA interferase MazF